MRKKYISKNKVNNFSDKIISLTPFIATALVPVVVVIIGNFYTSTIKAKENRIKYTELAIDILNNSPSDENKHIREWAVDLINYHSGVRMNKEAKDQLLNKSLIELNLEGTDFTASSIRNSIFNNVDLNTSSFSKVNFRSSYFSGSYFGYSIFEGAIFTGSDFNNSDFRGVDLSNIIFDENTIFPEKK